MFIAPNISPRAIPVELRATENTSDGIGQSVIREIMITVVNPS